jgi:hypothetical protein
VPQEGKAGPGGAGHLEVDDVQGEQHAVGEAELGLERREPRQRRAGHRRADDQRLGQKEQHLAGPVRFGPALLEHAR